MRYVCPLIAVRDMETSKTFYRDLFGLEVVDDFGVNVSLTGGLSLQTLKSWQGLLQKDASAIQLENHAGELYFEEDDLEGFMARLKARGNVRLVHPITEHSWGQRALRLYDPDGHVLEVGESLTAVIRRFQHEGQTAEEIARRMDVPLDYVQVRMA